MAKKITDAKKEKRKDARLAYLNDPNKKLTPAEKKEKASMEKRKSKPG